MSLVRSGRVWLEGLPPANLAHSLLPYRPQPDSQEGLPLWEGGAVDLRKAVEGEGDALPGRADTGVGPQRALATTQVRSPPSGEAPDPAHERTTAPARLTVRDRLAAVARRLAPPLGIFLASRAALGMVLVLALKLPSALGVTRFLAFWDGGWYLDIAKHGYSHALLPAPQQTNHNFFPLYPLLIRAAHALFGSWVGSALAVSLACSALAMVAIYLLVERLTDREAALRTVALVSFFPWGFIFSMAYAEGLLMLLAAVCLLALLDEHWLVAGLAAAAAGAARPNGLVLVFPCAWAALVAIRRTRSPWPLIAPALAPLGTLAFFLFLQRRTGDFLANLHARQSGWTSHENQLQLSQLGHVISTYLRHPGGDLNKTASLISLALIVVGLVLMARWRPPVIVWLYTVPILALTAYYGPYSSTLRYTLTAFPLLAALGRRLRGGPFWAAIGVSSMLMGMVFALIGTTTWLVP